MNQLLELQILGDPAPQGSKRIINGRLVEASSTKLNRWRKAIAAACKEATGWELSKAPIEVEVVFYLPRPVSVSPTKRYYPIVPPDLDKLVRGLLDGIGQSGVVWGDDSQVIRITAWKHYADQLPVGAEVRLWEI